MTNFVPISFEKFGDKRWKRFKQMDFAAKDAAVPLTAQETPRAILSMPIGFVAAEDSYQLVALQGLEAYSNLFLDSENQWIGGYIPHHYFCYPFQLIEGENDALVLCIDEDSALITHKADEDAEDFYDSEAKPAAIISDVLKFISEYFANTKKTKKICDLLNRYQLIRPWPLQASTAKGGILLKALYCIDEERLNNLSATELKRLRNEDALIVAYAQLFSTQNVSILSRQFDNALQPNKQQAPEIDFETSDSGGSISFENL